MNKVTLSGLLRAITVYALALHWHITGSLPGGTADVLGWDTIRVQLTSPPLGGWIDPSPHHSACTTQCRHLFTGVTELMASVLLQDPMTLH